MPISSKPGFLAACGLLAVLLAAMPARAATFEVRAVMSRDGAQVYFDPVGLHIQPGDTVRWIQVNGYHSITAYHPANGDRELRIPEGARAWDSGMLLAEYPAKGSTFEHTFTIAGVYDYLCMPHEAAGMVGRVIVGEPGGGPGTRPFGYASNEHWKPVPQAAQHAFPAIALILQSGSVRAPAAVAGKQAKRAGRMLDVRNSKEPTMKSDSELQQDARAELMRAPGVDAGRIDVRVRDGVAILTGNVGSEAEAWSAADAVRRVPGVQQVSNETMIVRDASVLPADAEGDVARPWFPPG